LKYQEIKITDAVLTQTALEIASVIAKSCPVGSETAEIQAFKSGEFKASAGYLANWKERYHLVLSIHRFILFMTTHRFSF
jgi:hypothetical protein